MFYVLQNESVAARRRVPILLTDAATGTTAQAGVALTAIYAYVNSNGGSFSGGAGTVANSGFGQYYYEFDPGEIGTLGLAGIHITAAACRDYDAIVQVAAFDMYSASSGASSYAIAQEVWNTNLTNFNDPDLAGGMQKDTYSLVSAYLDTNVSSIPASVWNTDMPSYSTLGDSAGQYLYNLGTGTTGYPSGGSGISAADVWDFVITGFGQTGSAALYTTQTNFTVGNIESYVQTQTPQDVWTYAGIEGRTITGGAVSSVLDPVTFSSSQYSAIASSVWNAGTRTITGGTADTVSNVTGNVSGSVGSVLGNVSGNVVGSVGSVTGNVAGSVNSVTTPVSLATSSMTGIAGTVWNSLTSSYTATGTYGNTVLRSDAGNAQGNVTLRSAGGINMVDADVHRIDNDVDAATYLKDILTGVGSTITGNIVGSVTSVVDPVTVSTSSMTGIAGTVWSTDVSGYSSPSAGYDLANVGTGSGLTAGDVWTYATRTVTGGTITSVTNPVDVSASSRSSIASTVWNQSSATYDTGGSNPIASLSIIQNQVAETEERVVGLGATVWEYATRTLTSGAGISAYDVWNFDPSGMSSPQAGGIISDTLGNTNSISGDITSIPGNVWASDVSGYVNPGEAGFELTQAAAGAGLTAGDVWDYATRTLTSGGSGISAADVWTYGSRTITGGIADTVTNVTGSVGSVLGNISGNVVGSVASVLGNVSGNVIGSVASVTGNVAGSVASVTSPVTFSSAQYASIASSVWNAATRTLTSGGSGISAADVWTYATRTLTSGGSGISAYDVWNFVLSDANTAEVDLVQAASGAGLTAGDVWTYGSREITGGLADTVTSVTNAVTVGTNNDKTGYALSAGGVTAVQSGLSTLTQAQVGTEVDSSLSDVGLTSTVTGRIDVAVSSRLASSSYETPPTAASIASSVWSAGSRTITGGTVDNLTNPATVATSSMTGIAGTVWNYSTRTITAGGGATAGDVWTYPTRSLTSGAGITVNAATNIINGPYFVKSNVDGQDGNLDVITGMVQDIQLTVTDAFGNPFDTTALGLAVNFYNQAGTLTTSYGTSQLYGPAGLVQFTLDTAVTGVEGRYNLILSAAGAGNTIKFGPLTTLVRPY